MFSPVASCTLTLLPCRCSQLEAQSSPRPGGGALLGPPYWTGPRPTAGSNFLTTERIQLWVVRNVERDQSLDIRSSFRPSHRRRDADRTTAHPIGKSLLTRLVFSSNILLVPSHTFSTGVIRDVTGFAIRRLW